MASAVVSSCRFGGTANNEAQSGHTHEEYVNRTGDSMGGLLRLPKNGLVVGNVTLSVWGNGVGIGTRVPDPNAQLEVQSSGIAKVLIKGTGGLSSTRAELALDRTVDERGGGIRIIASTDGAAEWWAGVPYSEGSPSDMFQIGRHATQPEYDTNANLTITSTGAVGIRTGRLTPSGDLHVKGTSSGYLTIGSTGANTFDRGIVFHDISDTAAGYLVVVPNTIGIDSVMRFYVGGAAAGDLKMVVDDDGQVGIGTSGPSARLHVVGGGVVVGAPAGGNKGAGTINAENVYDDNVLLTDYVFEKYFDGRVIDRRWKSYEMKSFDEEIKHAREKKHLSTLTGRKEWETKGKAPVGKILTQLWETVETHFLYLVEQKERISLLEAKLETQAREITDLKARLENIEKTLNKK